MAYSSRSLVTNLFVQCQNVAPLTAGWPAHPSPRRTGRPAPNREPVAASAASVWCLYLSFCTHCAGSLHSETPLLQYCSKELSGWVSSGGGARLFDTMAQEHVQEKIPFVCQPAQSDAWFSLMLACCCSVLHQEHSAGGRCGGWWRNGGNFNTEYQPLWHREYMVACLLSRSSAASIPKAPSDHIASHRLMSSSTVVVWHSCDERLQHYMLEVVLSEGRIFFVESRIMFC